MANVKITTGQYVNIEQRMASVSDRVFAQLLDMVFMWVYVSIISLIFGLVYMSSTHEYSSRVETTMTFIYVALLLPFIFYHPIFEFFFNGASPGKKILKLKVVQVDGSSPTLGAYIMRWMMYLLECAILPGIGLLCIIFNKKGQRLGDMMAGTIVIKNDEYTKHIINLNNFGYVNEGYRPFYPEVATLSLHQAEVVRETLMNNNSNRDFYINELSQKIMEHLNIPPLVNGSNEKFLDTILNDYRYYSSTIEI
jgi:uncharacterized RDD family membrane protein YckC